jgi:hypothetical protein
MIMLLYSPEHYSCINAVFLVITQANSIALSNEEFHLVALFFFYKNGVPLYCTNIYATDHLIRLADGYSI